MFYVRSPNAIKIDCSLFSEKLWWPSGVADGRWQWSVMHLSHHGMCYDKDKEGNSQQRHMPTITKDKKFKNAINSFKIQESQSLTSWSVTILLKSMPGPTSMLSSLLHPLRIFVNKGASVDSSGTYLLQYCGLV